MVFRRPRRAADDDGIVEAIELPAAEFALGVQWELQESWQDDAGCFAVFEAFVRAAARRSARSSAPVPA
jgi:gamma-glutamyl-gamma-aminobutyrate hydrolase PuuD